MSKLTKIIKMEFHLTVANKAYIILTLLGPILIAAITVLPSLVSRSGNYIDHKITKIALVGADASFVREIAPAFLQAYIELTVPDVPADKIGKRVLEGEWDGYILMNSNSSGSAPLRYISKDSGNFRVLESLKSGLGQALVTQKLLKEKIPAVEIAALTRLPVFEMGQLKKDGSIKIVPEYTEILTTGLMFAMLLYTTLILYGQVIARSVLTEKTDKTVEIMLSSVHSMELLFGKILGKALASLLQYGIWISASILVIKFIGPWFGVSFPVSLSLNMLAYLVSFFILGFFLYCSIYAALGAGCEDEQHLGQLAWPIILFLIIPVMMISLIITAPHAPVIIALSLFPMTSPIVMFLRILSGSASGGEIILSIVLLIMATFAAIWFSSKIFKVGILMTGKRFTLGEVFRLFFYK